MNTPLTPCAVLAAERTGGTAAVWRHFDTLCQTPRASKHEAALREALRNWARTHGLAATVDAAGNLILRKPASSGCEGKPGVILQGHLDMVCQANSDVAHDFSRDPISPLLKDGWLVAEHTTLGADNGIGVALGLAALEATGLRHGPLEVLLTVDEEAGMGGARGLQPGSLAGRFLINLDTEEWGEFYIGCAGGLDVNVSRPAVPTPISVGATALAVSVAGLCGGHSGCDIHLGRGNAIKLLVHILRAAGAPVRLATLQGGSARNAIPREAGAVIVIEGEAEAVRARLQVAADTVQQEVAASEPGLRIDIVAATVPDRVLDSAASETWLAALHAAPVGVRRMSDSVAGVVETSNNLGVVGIENGALHANLMVRSLVDSAGMALAEELASLFRLAGCAVELEGHYPGWQPNPASALLSTSRAVYDRLFGADYGPSAVQVIHAGLECGIIGGIYPELDMVSFGPTIRGAHAPGERVDVASVDRCWALLVALLDELAR